MCENMIAWDERIPEIANLLNPPFCSLIIYTAILEYQVKAKCGMPFPLIYLILPIILHKNTRDKIGSETNMIIWLQNNPELLVGFADRSRNLVCFTNEAIEFLLFQNICVLCGGNISISKKISKFKISTYIYSDQEIEDCIQKGKRIGRWFYYVRAVESIYAAWGVKP